MRKIVIIPAYNEEKTIRAVAKKARLFGDVVVIDDSSTDKTVRLVKDFKIIKNKENKGKGFSLRRGFNYAIRHNYDVIITLDGDGEHSPDEIPLFIKEIKKADFVVGQRKIFRSNKRKFLNVFSNFWFRMLFSDIDDVQCGFRAIKKELLKKLDLKSNGFEIEIEMLLEAVKNNAKLKPIYIETKPLEKTSVKLKDYIKINNFFDKWVLENSKYLNINKLKKILLIVLVVVGLFFGKIFEVIVKWQR